MRTVVWFDRYICALDAWLGAHDSVFLCHLHGLNSQQAHKVFYCCIKAGLSTLALIMIIHLCNFAIGSTLILFHYIQKNIKLIG